MVRGFRNRTSELGLSLTSNTWDHPYDREQAAYPVESLRRYKYWAPVNRVDNVYGDRNLFCACVPMSEYAQD